MTRRCSLGPTAVQQDAAMERLKRRQANKIAAGLSDAVRIAKCEARVLSVNVDYRSTAPADRRVRAEVRYDCGTAHGFFASFEAAIPWLRDHGVPEDILTGTPERKPHMPAVEDIARAWASIDGKRDEFDMGKGKDIEEEGGGYYQGYMSEAEELLKRAAKYAEKRRASK